MVLLLVAPIAPGFAQTNGFSFSGDAEQLEALLADPAPPRIDCRELVAHDSADYRIDSVATDPDMPSGACTVHGSIGPNVEFVINLPVTWNGRLYIHGNGGYGGESVHGRYGLAVRQRAVELGFAAGFTNLGHDAQTMPGATFANDNREAEIDFSYRALHRTTVAAKSIVAAYYGRGPRYSYFEGCSTGGGQGLKAAQRYPDDYDGIAVGAPVFDFVGLQLYGWNNQMAIQDAKFDAEMVARLGAFILERYDDIDGVVDGVIDDPRRVDFQPMRDLPKARDDDTGFSDAQIRALGRIYAGLVVDGEQLAPGIPPGAEPAAAESGWATRLIPDANGYMQQQDNVATWLKFLAFEEDDPDYDWTLLDTTRDLPRLAFMAQIMDVTSTNFDRIRARGGKILMYHGWADTGVNPLMTANYYDRVLADNGPDVRDDFRLFMVPGMFHCRGGFNVDRFDAITPVIQWVEQDRAPNSLPAIGLRNNAPVRERLLCAYPDVARYSGSGSVDDSQNFRCVSPPEASTPGSQHE